MAIDNAGPSTPPVDTSSMTAQDMGPLNGTAPAGLPPISTPAAVAASTAPMPQGQPSPSQQAMNAATEPMQPGRTPAPEADLPAPGPAKPGLWAGILQGALVGLAGSAGAKHFGGGLAMGAEGFEKNEQLQKENAVQQQQLAMQKTFQTAQAAEMIVNAHVKEKQLANMDQEQRDAHNTQALDQIERLKQIFPGAVPTITPNTPEATTAAIKADAAANGGIGPKLIFNVGDNHVSFDINQLSQAPQALTLVNEGRRLQGQPPLDAASYAKFSPAQQADMINKAGQLGTETPTQEQLDTYRGYLATATDRPDDGNKAADVARLTGIVGRMKTGVKSHNADVAKQAGDVVAAQEAAKNTPSALAHEAEAEGAKETARLKAKAAAAAYTPGNMMVGSMPDGSQVAGTADELQRAGAAGVTKLDADTGKKVIVSRQLIAPDGLFQSVNADIRKLDQEGQLGVVGSRWNEFMSGKVGTGPEFAALRTHMGLLATALMQAHVGARGSKDMLEHFESLADYKISDGATLRSALGAEYGYVKEKAMLPKKPLAAPVMSSQGQQ